MKLNRAIALRISNLMIKKKIPSQYAVYTKAGLSETTFRNVINETHESINVKTLTLICDGLGITIQEFFDDELFKRENLDVE